MASKFSKATKAIEGIKEVAQTSNEQANLITIKYYKDEDLQDYPRNNEDISDTEDIEKSIAEQGFTDPIEITDFNCEKGKYTIVSGHRRRMAGRKAGLKKFPCILRHFGSDAEVHNYVLFSNAQRDSAKDPLLFAKRYKMHEEYLKENGFKGSIREEIAKRLGLKPAQADRYNQMNKVILPVWDMVREGTVGMSSVTDSGMYTHTTEEQEEILHIMKECLNNSGELTRPVMRKIVNGFRNGKKSWNEVNEPNEAVNSVPVTNSVPVINIDTSPTETKEKEHSPLERNNEINYDFTHREELPSGADPLAEERPTDEDKQAIAKALENDQKEKKPALTDEEKKLQTGDKIYKNINALDELLNDFYKFDNSDKAESTIKTMTTLIKTMITEMESIGETYNKKDIYECSVEEIINIVNNM